MNSESYHMPSFVAKQGVENHGLRSQNYLGDNPQYACFTSGTLDDLSNISESQSSQVSRTK